MDHRAGLDAVMKTGSPFLVPGRPARSLVGVPTEFDMRLQSTYVTYVSTSIYKVL